MTRKDYIALAHALAKTYPAPSAGPEVDRQWSNDVNAVAALLAADRSRFDRAKFISTIDAALARARLPTAHQPLTRAEQSTYPGADE